MEDPTPPLDTLLRCLGVSKPGRVELEPLEIEKNEHGMGSATIKITVEPIWMMAILRQTMVVRYEPSFFEWFFEPQGMNMEL